MSASKAPMNGCRKYLKDSGQRFTWLLGLHQQTTKPGYSDDDAFGTHTLTANMPCPDEQQSVSLSGYRNDEFKKDLRPQL